MPRLSERARVQRDLNKLAEELDDVLLASTSLRFRPVPIVRFAQCVDAVRTQLQSSRYLLDRKHRGKSARRFDAIISGEDTEYPVKDNEFLFHYRMTRHDFSELVKLLKENPVFHSSRRQAPPAHQILVLLKYLGTEGNQANNRGLGGHFGIGSGTAQLYRDRALLALLSLQSQRIFGPTKKSERLSANGS